MPSLYNDTVFEYYEKLEQNSIKKLDILLENYHLKLDAYKDYFSRGSFNNTFSVKVDKEGDPMHNKVVLIRKGKESYGKFDNNGNSIVHMNRDITLKQIKRNESNWFQCNLKAICPNIYYYGYFKHDDSEIYPIMITEKYDSDLFKFLYNNKELSPLQQESIANQLEYLFKTLISLKIICYDIKPENTVIRKNEDGTLDLRLIDVDGDYCLSYKKDSAYPPLKTDEQKELVLILSLLFYGNYLFYWNQNNILNNKIQELLDNYNNKYNKSSYESLKKIFIENQNNNNNYSNGNWQFNFFSVFYLINSNTKAPKKLTDTKNNPPKLFDILFDNAVFKNETTKKLQEKKNKRRSRIQPASAQELSNKEPLTVKEIRNMMAKMNIGGKGISKCKKITTKKKYTTRKSPPYSASKCARGTRKKGNDGKMYIVKATTKGVNRWLPVVSKKTKKSKK